MDDGSFQDELGVVHAFSTPLSLNESQQTGDEPVLGGELRQKAVWVEESDCIGCRYCAHVASNTFLMIAETGNLPVPNFAAGGVATPADASLMMQLGAEAVFVGSGIFKSGDPEVRAKAIVEATTHYEDPDILIRVSENLGEAMVGINMDTLDEKEKLQTRGW